MKVWVVHKGWSVYGVYKSQAEALEKHRKVSADIRKGGWGDPDVYISQSEVT